MERANQESILAALREYFMQCPYLKDGRFGVDYLPNEVAYSLDTLPSDPVYKVYVDGGKLYQLQYAFTSKEEYDGDTLTMIDNSLFYQRLSAWVEEQNDADILPVLTGYQAISNTVISGGYLYDADADLGKYQIQMQLIYE